MREKVRVYVPKRLVIYYRKEVSRNPRKYWLIEKSINSSRLPLTVHRLLAIAIFYSFIASVVGIIFGFILFEMLIPEEMLIKAVLGLFGQQYNSDESYFMIVFGFLFFWMLVFGIIAFNFVNYLILYYPAFISNQRKNEIEMYMPHAINMMLGMASGGLGIYEITKSLAESRSMFGELSREFETIYRSSELFKEDIITSIRYVRDTTPSDRLSAFLDDFIFMVKGGGSIYAFLENKSKEHLEGQEIGFNSFLEFLGMMAEVYLSAFILLPLFMLIMLVVMQVSGEVILESYKYIILTILPVSTLVFIYIIKSSMPLPSVKTEINNMIVKDEIKVDLTQGESKFKVKRFRRILNKIKIYFHFPYLDRALYTLQYRIFLFHLFVFSLIIFITTYHFFKFDSYFAISISAFIIPLLLFIEIKERAIKQIESRIPDVFRELAILNEAGLNIIEALKVLTTVEFGVISRELNLLRKDIEWGESVTRAFKKMEIRIKSDLIAKVIPISIKAIDTSPTFKDAFLTVSNFANAEVRFKERISGSMMTYVVIIYFSIAVFLVIVYTLINNIIYGFGDATPISNVEVIKETFLEISVAVGFLSGIIAGVISSGRVTAGLKHSYIFLVLIYVIFWYFIP